MALEIPEIKRRTYEFFAVVAEPMHEFKVLYHGDEVRCKLWAGRNMTELKDNTSMYVVRIQVLEKYENIVAKG